MQSLLWILMIMAIVFLGFMTVAVISAIVRGYLEVKTRPRTEMMWCSKHGHFRKEFCLTMPTNNATICPSCYWEAIKGAHQA